MYSADKFLRVSLYSCCCSACIFVRLDALLQVSSSNRFLFLYSLIYMQHDYYQRATYQCVMSYAGSLPILLRHPLNKVIELEVLVTNICS
jgi:predicted adenine nucleotide alpha hydrolase (AANH) superfamily ATPase